MNIKIGITNIQMYLQFKRLQLCPCPLCFPQILKRGLPWEKHSPAQEVFKKQPTQVTANIRKTDTSNWRVFAGDS